jgi:CelD/BcsL family acetyltransferase involved in cellulose biosynthesis
MPAVSGDTALTAFTASTVDEFVALRPGWDDLVRSMQRPSPFLLHGWLEAWCRHYVQDGDLRVHDVTQNGSLVGAIPLFVERRRGLRIAQFLGASQSALADMLVAPSADGEVVEALVRLTLDSDHDYADLFGFPADSHVASSRSAVRLRMIERVEAPILDLAPGFEAVYLAKTSAKRRNLHKRRLRQLSELGELEFSVARTGEELSEALEHAFTLHHLRWSGRPDGSGFGTKRGMAFHRDAILALARLGIPRIVLLRLSGRPIAFHYYFALSNCMYVHRLAFDPEFAKHSPGVITTLETLRVASDEGLTRVEFLGGDERYKVELADAVKPLYQGVGMATTAKGRIAVSTRLGTIAARRRLKRFESLRGFYFEGLAPVRRVVARARRTGR